ICEELGITMCPSNEEAMKSADVAVIAVKPQDAPVLLQDMHRAAHPGHLVVSIAAGVRASTIEAALPPGIPVVRVMPNTPAFVHEGMAVIARGHHATDEHEAVVKRIFECVGRA